MPCTYHEPPVRIAYFPDGDTDAQIKARAARRAKEVLTHTREREQAKRDQQAIKNLIKSETRPLTKVAAQLVLLTDGAILKDEQVAPRLRRYLEEK